MKSTSGSKISKISVNQGRNGTARAPSTGVLPPLGPAGAAGLPSLGQPPGNGAVQQQATSTSGSPPLRPAGAARLPSLRQPRRNEAVQQQAAGTSVPPPLGPAGTAGLPSLGQPRRNGAVQQQAAETNVQSAAPAESVAPVKSTVPVRGVEGTSPRNEISGLDVGATPDRGSIFYLPYQHGSSMGGRLLTAEMFDGEEIKSCLTELLKKYQELLNGCYSHYNEKEWAAFCEIFCEDIRVRFYRRLRDELKDLTAAWSGESNHLSQEIKKLAGQQTPRLMKAVSLETEKTSAEEQNQRALEECKEKNNRLQKKIETARKWDEEISKLHQAVQGEINMRNTKSICFNTDNLWFATYSGRAIPGVLEVSNNGSYAGSIYFDGGRIRLLHQSGPQISLNDWTRSFGGKENILTKDNWREKVNAVEKDQMKSNKGITLYEYGEIVKGNHTFKGHHTSRGVPGEVKIGDQEIRELYFVAARVTSLSEGKPVSCYNIQIGNCETGS